MTPWIKNSTCWRVLQVVRETPERFWIVPVVTYRPVVGGTEKPSDLSSAVMMVDSEPPSTTSRPAASDSAPASLRLQEALVVTWTKSVDGLYFPVVVAGFLRPLERPVMGEAPWTRELSLTLRGDSFSLTVTAFLQDRSLDMPRASPLRGGPRLVELSTN